MWWREKKRPTIDISLFRRRQQQKEQERAEVLPYVIKRQNGWLNQDKEVVMNE